MSLTFFFRLKFRYEWVVSGLSWTGSGSDPWKIPGSDRIPEITYINDEFCCEENLSKNCSSFATVEKNPYILLLVFPQTLWKSFNLSTLWKKMQFKPTLFQGRTILLDFCWEGAIRPFRGDFDEFPCRFICLNYIIWSHKIFIYWSCFKVK